jgi:hypothetical protein
MNPATPESSSGEEDLDPNIPQFNLRTSSPDNDIFNLKISQDS